MESFSFPVPLDRSGHRARSAFDYALTGPDGELRFTERVTFRGPADTPPAPQTRATLDRVLELLHLVAGVSYYKVAAPPRLLLPAPLGEAATALVTAVYTKGLAEYAYRNQLPHVLDLAPEVPPGRPAEPAAGRQRRPAAAVRGRRRQGLDRQPGGAAAGRARPGAVLGQPQPRHHLGQRGLRADPAGRPAPDRPGAVRAERGRAPATGTSRSPRSTR